MDKETNMILELNSFCEKITLSKEATKFVLNMDVSEDECLEWMALFDTDIATFHEQIRAKSCSGEWYLVLYIRFAMFLKERFMENNISMEVYVDTFSDIAVWEQDCYEKTGNHGLLEVDWLERHLKMQVFRIGRLQFEPIILPEILAPYKICTQETKVFNVHIPKGVPLAYESVKASYEGALEFWNLAQAVFICHSWMLSPVLKELLSPTSNILAFGDDFTVFDEELTSRQAEERIFGFVLENPEGYPTNTNLQKRAKDYIISKGKIPAAWGYHLFEKE